MTGRGLFSGVLADALADDPIVLVDAGARGELEEPWRHMSPSALRVLGFEPDPAECERLNAAAPDGHRFLPVALWDRAGEVDVHVAAVPTCSSVHPPNAELLASYAAEHVAPRDTVSVERLPATTLDAALDEHELRCDVLKVDTQGAEGEILRGAGRSLRADVLCAVIETWTVEVHRGQALTGDVLRLMADAGLQLFDLSVAAAWGRPLPEGIDLDAKRQVTGVDLLFLRTDPDLEPESRRLKLAAIADVYGFTDVALQILDRRPTPLSREARRAIVAGAASAPGPRRLVDRVLRRPGPEVPPPVAGLHG